MNWRLLLLVVAVWMGVIALVAADVVLEAHIGSPQSDATPDRPPADASWQT